MGTPCFFVQKQYVISYVMSYVIAVDSALPAPGRIPQGETSMRSKHRHRFDWGFEAFDPRWWLGMPPGRRRRRRQWFEAGDMKYVILDLLREKPMHGYEVMKALEERTRGYYQPSPGTVYPTLQWLEDEGLVEVNEVSGKKVYSVTAAGEGFLDENRSTVDAIFDRVSETLDRVLGGAMPDVNAAFGRLATQVYRTAWKLGGDDAKKRKIVEILDRTVDDLASLVS